MTNRKQIIKSNCANYINGLCVMRDIECPLVHAIEYRGHKFPCEEQTCDYFDRYVLGIVEEDKEVKVRKTVYSYKPCNYCNKQFKPSSPASKYCSVECRDIGNRKSHRKYNSKRKIEQ